MFLKSLTLKGFKSFADTTTLEFEPGVTVVVGPNGSGKSNIVDAVAWVLGAQGPRTVRSSKMEDVIFAGTPKRPALGRAEVSLTIDNQAGLLPIEFSEVTLTRTLFRSGDSEYAINGVSCRLLDIQELLSDTGVGRQQHVIVSQGQLDAVLNARPEDRRLIIEEAAGILKYRRRKEKAERRLESTESSLLRLQDLLREVRRQLRPLERQAEAARRHDDLVAELRAIRRYLAGRELAALEARLGSNSGVRADLTRAEEQQRVSLSHLDQRIVDAEGELAQVQHRAEQADLVNALSRAERLGATARGLGALIAERQRSAERDRLAIVDQDVVASLEAEAARVSEALVATEEQGRLLLPELDELAEAEAVLDAEAKKLENDPGVGTGAGANGQLITGSRGTDHPHGPAGPATPAEPARPADPAEPDEPGDAASVAETRAELMAARTGADAARAELGRLDGRFTALAARLARLDQEATGLLAAAAESEAAEAALSGGVEQSSQRRRDAEIALAAAEAAKVELDAEHHRWSARAEALALALDEARARAGAERLAGVDGVVGTLLEVVEVDQGWGLAFEAAAAEAVSAIVVDGIGAARRSLEHLRGQNAAGAVVPLGPAGGTPGPIAPDLLASLRHPAIPVRSYVRARSSPGGVWSDGQRAAVEHLLDRLLAHAVVVEGGWVEALDVVLAAPDLVVVTRDGDRFASSGWRTGTAAGGATGAALEEARGLATQAADAAARQTEAVVAGRREVDHVREEEAELTRRRHANSVRRAAVVERTGRVEAERRELMGDHAVLVAQRGEVVARLTADTDRIGRLEQLLPALEQVAAVAADQAQAARARQVRLAERVKAVAALRRHVEVKVASLEQRRAMLADRLAELESYLRRHADERARVALRRERLSHVAAATERLAALVATRGAQLDVLIGELRAARQAEADAIRAVTSLLGQQRGERSAAERTLSELREKLARVQLDEAETRIRFEALVGTIRRDLECEPDSTRDARCPELPAGTGPTTRARDLERELRLMGPINPLALEEYTALQERHGFLEGQLDDVRSARRELGKVIRAVDAEIVEVFRAAYADVAENFEKLFTTLFPGGFGRLRLTDPDHLLDTGIEVEARPSGKNIRRLSLLSGGERSLTALALLFAVFRSRPSPFYLMDEVEAALDDVNLHRFLDLLREFRSEAQLLVVSHQKRTMEAADWLYGVTMQSGGSSKVVSERIGAGA